MADRGRDLKIGVLADADQFDLGRPATELDQLADHAADAGQELSQLAREGEQLRSLGDDATGAARDVERLADSGDQLRDLGQDADRAGADVTDLGQDAEKAAARVDGAMDKIAAASKHGASKMEDAGREGGESMREMGEEGAGTAREMAASFDGSAASIQDAIQETAANALAALGPLGAAVGIGAALGIGAIRAKAEALRETVSELVGTLIDGAGKMDQSAISDRLRQLAEDGSINDLAEQARRANVPVSDYLRALAGDPAALDRTREALKQYGGAIGLELDTMSDARFAASEMNVELDNTAEAFGLAEAAVNAFQASAEDVPTAVQEHADAVASFSDSSSIYQGLLDDAMAKEQEAAQNTADKTKDQSDSWEDYAKDVSVSVDEYLDELQRQVEAQEKWSANLATLARRGVGDGVLAELQRMGPEGAPLVAALTKASDAELTRMVGLYARKGVDSTGALESGLRSGKPGVVRETSELRADMKARLSGPINVPVGVTGPSAAELGSIRRSIANGLDGITVGVDAIARTVVSRSVP